MPFFMDFSEKGFCSHVLYNGTAKYYINQRVPKIKNRTDGSDRDKAGGNHFPQHSHVRPRVESEKNSVRIFALAFKLAELSHFQFKNRVCLVDIKYKNNDDIKR